MAVTKPNDSLKDTFDDTLYTACRLIILAATQPLAVRIETERVGLRKLSAKGVEASEEVVRAQAARDYAFEQVQENLIVFEKGVDHMCAQDPKAYAGWFPLTPAKMNKAPEKNRVQIFEPVIKRAREQKQGSLVLQEAKTFVGLWDAYVAAEERHTKALEAETEAAKAVQNQKVQACVAMREVYGLLVAKHPDNLAKAEAYFRRRGGKGKKKTLKPAAADGAPPETPAAPAPQK